MDNSNENARNLRRGVAGDLHSGLTEDQVMFRTLIAMCIPAIAAVIAMGTNALFNILTALVVSLICHYILKAVDLNSIRDLKNVTYETPYSPLVAGMIVGLCMGELSPYYVTAFVAALTMVGFKWGQEKYFGRKIINPAAGAKALVLLAITITWFLPDSLTSGMLFYPEHLMYNLFTEEGFLGAMELAEQMNFYGTENLSITQSLILWKRHGWIGGASGILTLASGVLLAFWIKLKWRISVSYLLAMTVLSIGVGMATGGHLLMRIAFHVFTGSVMFLAFYMATEPQTTPVTFKAQYLFGIILAILTMGLQMLGLFGSSFIALAILNPYVSYLDKIDLKNPFGEKERKFSPAESLPTAPDTTSPVLTYDPSKCITCSRCIKACEEIQGNGILGYGSRGQNIFATAGLGERGSSSCVGCGECLEFCPTGALREKYPVLPLRDWEIATTETTCSYCGIGCQLELYPQEKSIAKVRGVDNPPNNGSLCIRGRFGHTYIDQQDRLTQPLQKRDGSLEPITWEEALEEIATRLKEYKSNEIGGLSSPQNTNEENYLFQKFMRAVLGTNNVDYFSRLCHSASTLGLEKVLGWRGMTNSIKELKETDCILIVEADVTESHPIIANYIKQAVSKNDKNLIVISSRKTRITNWADVWINPQDNTEIALINGMMNLIVNEQIFDERFIENNVEDFSELITTLKDYPPEKVSQITGISLDKLIEAGRMFGEAKRASIVYGMGLTEHENSVDKVISLANLALITGNIGKHAAGLYPLKDQNNDQGSNDMGVVPDLLPGYQKIEDNKVRKKFEDTWERSLPTEKGLNAVEMINNAVRGELKAMLIMGDSEEFSEPGLGEIKRGFENLEFLVAVTPFLNEAAEEADLVLPAATFAEKDGSFTNIERRISRVRKAFNPPEGAKIDWEILGALASRMGYDMNYEHPSEIMDEISSLTPVYENVTYESLEGNKIQWPVNDNDRDYLAMEDLTSEKVQLIPTEYSVPAEDTEKDNDEFNLTTERILFHFRTGFIDPQVKALNSFIELPYVEINPQDAEALGIENEEKVNIITHFGEVEVESRVTEQVNPGTVYVPYQFLPFHFAESEYEFNESNENSNQCKIPEFKISSCRIEKTYS